VRVVRPLARRGVVFARPLVTAHAVSSMLADRDSDVLLLDIGPADDLHRVGTALGATLGVPAPTGRRPPSLLMAQVGVPDESDVIVGLALPGRDEDHARIAGLAGAYRRQGGAAVVAVVGTPGQRRRTERALLADPDMGVSALVHLPSLVGDDLGRLIDRVVRALGVGAVAAGRRQPALRPHVARRLQRRAAVRAAVVGLAAGRSRAAMPVITTIQANLAADMHGLASTRPDPVSLGQAAAVGAAARAWRASARRLVRRAPGAAPVVQAAFPYIVTRLVGVGALLAASRDRHPRQEER
jgi:hypothetical protein